MAVGVAVAVVVVGKQGIAEGKQDAIVAEYIVAVGQEPQIFYEEGTTGSTDLLGGMSGLVEEKRSEDAHWVHFSEPSYFYFGPLLDSFAPSPLQMFYPPSSGNFHNPHWILNVKVQALVPGESTPASYHRNSHHMENTGTAESNG